jgi:hypothetical protein
VGLLVTALACLAAAAPGCGGPATRQSPPPAAFAISYERSGGLAATPQKLAVAPGRHGVLTTSGPSGRQTVRFRVGVTRIETLRRALERADFETIETPSPDPAGCADCYFYALRYEGHEVSFSQLEVPKGLRGVVDQLEAVIAAHRPRH